MDIEIENRKNEKLLKQVFDLLRNHVNILNINKSGQFKQLVIGFGFYCAQNRKCVKNAIIMDCKDTNVVIDDKFFRENHLKCNHILNRLKTDTIGNNNTQEQTNAIKLYEKLRLMWTD